MWAQKMKNPKNLQKIPNFGAWLALFAHFMLGIDLWLVFKYIICNQDGKLIRKRAPLHIIKYDVNLKRENSDLKKKRWAFQANFSKK